MSQAPEIHVFLASRSISFGQHLNNCGLARAIVAKQSDDLSRADLEGDLIDRSQATVGSSQSFNSYHQKIPALSGRRYQRCFLVVG